LELDQDTITGKNRLLYKKLIEFNEKKHLSEEEYYPTYIKAYIDYGAKLLEQEYKYSSDIYVHLINLEKGI
jgi:DNA sulfur modification protein DndE